MRHHAFSAAMGLLIAAILVPTSYTEAAAASVTGIWRKAEQGERPGKIQVFMCGRSKRLLCAKIVWLQDPLDSKGRPLHDVRNENPSMRDRPILGLPIISGMQPVARNQWKGNIYNPEDGNTYSATLTLVARNKIHLKGCKAWLLCGERTWLRTTLPKPEPEPEPEKQIEASAEPEKAPEQAQETATAAPEQAKPEESAFADAEMLTPVASHGTQAGYRFLNGSTATEDHAGFSGENVPSMFAMTKPIDADADADNEADAVAAAESAPTPAPKPAAQPPKPSRPLQANAAPAPQPQAKPKPAPAAPTASSEEEAAETEAEMAETETAEADTVEPRRLTWRERRQLRRQQRLKQEGQGLLPWLR